MRPAARSRHEVTCYIAAVKSGAGRGARVRRIGGVAIWIGVALAAVAAERWLLPALRDGAPGLSQATWIWAATERGASKPLAFLAVADFELATPPPDATLLLFGDEEYSVYLNAHWIGAGKSYPGAAADQFAVGPLLVAGRNRLVAELRSRDGSGGLLAALSASDGRPLLLSGERFRIVGREQRGLIEGADLGASEAPLLLGRPPLGRWGTLAVRPRREPYGDLPEPSPAASFRRFVERSWTAIDWKMSRFVPIGRQVTFDWGREVSGFLTLEFAPGEGRASLVLFGGERPPEIGDLARTLTVRLPERNYWLDSLPRRFRYVSVLGAETVVDAKVYLFSPGLAPSEVAARERRGVAGLAPPRSRSPAEDEIWRELERLAGEPVGQGR